MSKALEKLLVPAAVVGLVTGAAVSADAGVVGSTAPADGGAPHTTAGAAAPRHEHSIRSSRAEGRFTCGDLTLRVTDGRETEETDADLRHGVAHVSISRVSRRVVLAGSDGRTYRASSVVAAWFVLRAPDLEHPVSGLEVIQVMFRGGPRKSPGWLRETIRTVDGHETDVVSGPCDFAG